MSWWEFRGFWGILQRSQAALRLKVDMQGEAVGGGGILGQAAAILFQRGG